MIFCHIWLNIFLQRMPGCIDYNIRKYMMSFKKIRSSLRSFLWVHLQKNWEHWNVALSKPFNFCSKHFLILWRINEIFKKKNEYRYFSKNSKIFPKIRLCIRITWYDRRSIEKFFQEMTSNSWNWHEILKNF